MTENRDAFKEKSDGMQIGTGFQDVKLLPTSNDHIFGIPTAGFPVTGYV